MKTRPIDPKLYMDEVPLTAEMVRAGTAPTPMTDWMAKRTRVNEVTGCIEWMGGKDQGGYGRLYRRWDGGVVGIAAHRLSFSMKHKQIPKGHCVLHSCDNRACVNPEHLRFGTHSDNNCDARNRGRRLGGGFRSQVLTGEDIPGIKEMLAMGVSCAEIARQYGVSRKTICNIKHGRTWSRKLP